MTFQNLAEHIGARILFPGRNAAIVIERIYAGDRMSDLLNEVSDATLLVTHVSNAGLLRLVELMDIPGVCLLNAVEPEERLVAAARQHETALMVSPYGMFETCGRLYELFSGGQG